MLGRAAAFSDRRNYRQAVALGAIASAGEGSQHALMRIALIDPYRVLYVIPTAHEYTASLQARIAPLITGVGPVEAAIGLATALTQLEVKNEKPDLIVSLGSAGSRDLDHARVYQNTSVHYHDMDCTALGFPLWETPFLDSPSIIKLGPHIPGLPSATLASGARIINGADYDKIGAEMVEMETYSYARVAHQYGLPLISLRGVSDGKTELTQISDWTHTLEEIGDNLCAALTLLEEALATGAISVRA